MKNFLNYNYGIIPEKIYSDKKETKEIYFFINGYKIYIWQLENHDIDNLIEVSNKLYLNNCKINTIIANKEGKFTSKFKNKEIVLIRVNIIENDNLKFSDVLKMKETKDYKLRKIDLPIEWTSEVDLLENELSEYNDEHLIIKESFDYFIGCAENAIQLYKSSNNKGHQYSLGHYGNLKLNLKFFSNPLYIKNVDFNYESANYLKNKFINGTIDYGELNNILREIKNQDSFFACLLYPTYYFNLIKIILSNKDFNYDYVNKMLKDIIKNRNKYYEFLIFIKNHLKNKNEIQLLDWINK